ncbi:hypothetical protein EZS27_016388, partial [termite gut metagenome]
MYNFEKALLWTFPKNFYVKSSLVNLRLPTADEVDTFLPQLHSRLYEQMLEGELDAHLGYEKHAFSGNNS